MFRQVRYQTGELDEVVSKMKEGEIPCMDIDNVDELNWVIGQLAVRNVYKIEDLPYDKNARDRVKEPEFEYRIAFHSAPLTSDAIEKSDTMYIDFYFELDIDETYDPIFGD